MRKDKNIGATGGVSSGLLVGQAINGAFEGSANASDQTVEDTYHSTESTQSGVYAGSSGLDVDATGNTMLRAGALSSNADRNRQSNRQKPEITIQAHQLTVLRSLHLGIKTPEGKVVSDSQGKREIIVVGRLLEEKSRQQVLIIYLKKFMIGLK
jgi:hypothetical protein